MRAGYKIAVAGAAIVFGCAVAAVPSLSLLGATDSSEDVAPMAQMGAADVAAYRDGVYRATGTGKLGAVPVTVTISGGRIASVQVGQNVEATAMLEKAENVVIPQIIDSQGVEGVDAAAGATMTSNAIIEAVASALDRARV